MGDTKEFLLTTADISTDETFSYFYGGNACREMVNMPVSFEYAANMPGYPSTIPSHGKYTAKMPVYPLTIPPHVAEFTANIPAYFTHAANISGKCYRNII